jgi:hypothetical protein
VVAHGDAQPLAAAALGLFGALEHRLAQDDRVVAPHPALAPQAQVLIEIDVGERDESRRRVGRRAGEARVEVGQEALDEIPVGGLDRVDPGQAQFRHQPALERVRLSRSLRPRAWGE